MSESERRVGVSEFRFMEKALCRGGNGSKSEDAVCLMALLEEKCPGLSNFSAHPGSWHGNWSPGVGTGLLTAREAPLPSCVQKTREAAMCAQGTRVSQEVPVGPHTAA